MSLLTLLRTKSSAAVWTPASLANIVDFGTYRDLSRLKQDSAGTTAVTAADDPVGWWRGQLDAITLTQANAANKPKYAADGVYFLGGGTLRYLEHTLASPISGTAAFGMAYHADLQTSGNGKNLGWQANHLAATGVTRNGIRNSVNNMDYIVRVTVNNPIATEGDDTGEKRRIMSYDGSAAYAMINGTKYVLSVGTSTSNKIYLYLTGDSATGDADVKSKGWVWVAGAISDDDAALLDAWMAAGCPV